jgi:hypothetical protein
MRRARTAPPDPTPRHAFPLDAEDELPTAASGCSSSAHSEAAGRFAKGAKEVRAGTIASVALGVARPALEETRYFPPIVVGDAERRSRSAPQVAKSETHAA